jgi:hypothetical protein
MWRTGLITGCFYINVREYCRGNQKWTIQKNWQHRVHKIQKEEPPPQKKISNTIFVGILLQNRLFDVSFVWKAWRYQNDNTEAVILKTDNAKVKRERTKRQTMVATYYTENYRLINEKPTNTWRWIHVPR